MNLFAFKLIVTMKQLHISVDDEKWWYFIDFFICESKMSQLLDELVTQRKKEENDIKHSI